MSGLAKLVDSRLVQLANLAPSMRCARPLHVIMFRSCTANGMCEFLAGGLAVSALVITRLCERE